MVGGRARTFNQGFQLKVMDVMALDLGQSLRPLRVDQHVRSRLQEGCRHHNLQAILEVALAMAAMMMKSVIYQIHLMTPRHHQ